MKLDYCRFDTDFQVHIKLDPITSYSRLSMLFRKRVQVYIRSMYLYIYREDGRATASSRVESCAMLLPRPVSIGEASQCLECLIPAQRHGTEKWSASTAE